jgi:hypothetical protein
VSHQVIVTNGGCKEVFVQLKPQSTIEGTLLKPDGQPAVNQRVELLRRNQKGNWYSTSKMWTQTDYQGRFRFEDIGSGDYLLGFEIWSDAPSDYSAYDAQYFPGVRDRAAAETISLAPHQAIRDLRFPPAHKERKITIRVRWPDGKPSGKNLLQVFHDGRLIKNLEGENEGTLIFTGYQEREYEFNARYWVDNLGGGGPVFSKRIAKADHGCPVAGTHTVAFHVTCAPLDGYNRSQQIVCWRMLLNEVPGFRPYVDDHPLVPHSR